MNALDPVASALDISVPGAKVVADLDDFRATACEAANLLRRGDTAAVAWAIQFLRASRDAVSADAEDGRAKHGHVGEVASLPGHLLASLAEERMSGVAFEDSLGAQLSFEGLAIGLRSDARLIAEYSARIMDAFVDCLRSGSALRH